MSHIYREEAYPFYVKGRESVSPSYARERDSFSKRGEGVSLHCMQETETPSLKMGESVSLLCREEAGPFFIQKRECLISIERKQTPSLYRGESVSPL